MNRNTDTETNDRRALSRERYQSLYKAGRTKFPYTDERDRFRGTDLASWKTYRKTQARPKTEAIVNFAYFMEEFLQEVNKEAVNKLTPEQRVKAAGKLKDFGNKARQHIFDASVQWFDYMDKAKQGDPKTKEALNKYSQKGAKATLAADYYREQDPLNSTLRASKPRT